jgi:hypothetical protein
LLSSTQRNRANYPLDLKSSTSSIGRGVGSLGRSAMLHPQRGEVMHKKHLEKIDFHLDLLKKYDIHLYTKTVGDLKKIELRLEKEKRKVA